MEIKLSIFPFKAKFVGLAFIVLAFPFAYMYFLGGKPDIFNIKTFAIVTTYAETRYFVLSQTNILDELAAILFLLGISLFSFSKEKIEKEHYELLRTKALVKALFISISIWLISFLLIYGMAIFMVSFSIFVVFLLLYNCLYRFYLIRDKRSKNNPSEIDD